MKPADKCRGICSGAKNDKIYVISGNKQTSYGETTALLKKHGFIVISEKDFESRKRFDR
ncbi:hypothetical protein IIO_03235 [Bacillus cereus VD115]|nr:hypothetical protein IIO_03235 [Bacillus cereus VD115]